MASSLRRSGRFSSAATASTTSTPSRTHPGAHGHHESADELAVREAAKLLSDSEVEGELTSPRAERHAAIVRAREHEEREDVEAPGSGSQAGAAEPTGEPESGSDSGEEDASSGSDNDSDDDSDEDSDDDSDEDSDDDSDSDSDEEELDRHLAAARIAAVAATSMSDSKRSSSSKGTTGALGEDEAGELRFDAEPPKETPIPDLAVGALPAQVIAYAEDGTATAGPSRTAEARGSGAPELDRGAYQRTLSKREKLAQPKKASASDLWATLPGARADDLAQMKRDYQALALSHTLDPKRFMKGGNRAGKVPERFQIGTMVDAPRHLQDTTVRKERKYRAGEIVAGIIADDTLGSYAKRKFEDLQGKRMHNGRGKGWQKRAKW